MASVLLARLRSIVADARPTLTVRGSPMIGLDQRRLLPAKS